MEWCRNLNNGIIGAGQLDAVLAVAHHRGFRAAATDLGMSHSALSHAIAALEAKLGVRLFRRTTRSVLLTGTGEQFVSGVAPALGQIRDAGAGRKSSGDAGWYAAHQHLSRG